MGRAMSKGIILVIDDETDLLELVRYNLVKEGFDVIASLDGESGLSLAAQKNPDLIVVDLMLPGIDGLEVCRRLRAGSQTFKIPIIMLTAKVSESDRVVGLELGADDYVTKPFSSRELVARVKALLRRSAGFENPLQLIKCGDLTIDLARHEVSCDKIPVDLTATEFRLLQMLAGHPGRVFSRSELIDGALGRNVAVLNRTIDVHVMALRRKLGESGRWIETIRGFGYKFREENHSE
jgi:two-component system, OmpR family, alkaline phosphatase synthesis response regulator PhoP